MADVKTWQISADNAIPKTGSLPVDANTIIEGGRLVWSRIDTGYATNSTYALAHPTNVRCWGICAQHTDNSTATPQSGANGTAGSCMVPLYAGVSLLKGDSTVTLVDMGSYVYLQSDSGTTAPTVQDTDGGGSLPLVGYVAPYVRSSTASPDPSAIPVAIGMARPDVANPELPGGSSSAYRMTGVVTSNVGTLSSFTVASTDLTFVAGDQVLLVNQTTASQNGPYVVGTVTTGTAPLTRPDWWAAGTVHVQPEVFYVNKGTQGANSRWMITTSGSITVDTTSVTFNMIDGNWVQGVSTAVGTMAGQTNFFFVGATLKARMSGIFYVDLDVGWSDGTTADTVTFALISDTAADGAAAVLASANKAAHGVSGFGAFGTRGSDWESVDTNAGASLTFNGAAWSTAPITQASEVNPTLTGLLSGSAQKFGFHGICYNAAPTGTTKTPFTIGNQVAFGVKVTSTNTITVPTVRLTVRELSSQ